MMKLKRVGCIILRDVMMLDIIIMLIRLINVWVNASCFFNSCIRVLVSVVQCLGFCEGKGAGSACGMGGFSIA